MLFSQDAAFVIPVTSGNPSPAAVVIPPQIVVAQITVAFSDPMPAGGSIVIAGLKDGGDPTNAADYLTIATLTAPGTVTLADVGGARVFGKSGGTAGTVNVTVTATRSADLVALDSRYAQPADFIRRSAGVNSSQNYQGALAIKGTTDPYASTDLPSATATYSPLGFFSALDDPLTPDAFIEVDQYLLQIGFAPSAYVGAGQCQPNFNGFGVNVPVYGDSQNGGTDPRTGPAANYFFRSRGNPTTKTGVLAGDIAGVFSATLWNDVDTYNVYPTGFRLLATEDETTTGHGGAGLDVFATQNGRINTVGGSVESSILMAVRGEGIYDFPAASPLAPALGGGVGVRHVGRATTVPTAAPAVGCLLYVDPADDKLKAWRAGAVGPDVLTA